MALEFLLEEDGKTTVFGPGEVQEVIDHVIDNTVRDIPLELRWEIEDGISDAFGMKFDDDRDLVYAEGR